MFVSPLFSCRNAISHFSHFSLVDTPKSASYLEPVCSKCSCGHQYEIRHAATNYTSGNVSKPNTVSTFLTQALFPNVLTWASLKWSVSWSFNDVYKCSSLLERIYNESVISLTDIWSKAEGSLFCLLLLLSLLLDTSGLSRKCLLLFWIVLVIRSLSYEPVRMVPETWPKLCHIAELS